jgi:hypothetical protein
VRLETHRTGKFFLGKVGKAYTPCLFKRKSASIPRGVFQIDKVVRDGFSIREEHSFLGQAANRQQRAVKERNSPVNLPYSWQ